MSEQIEGRFFCLKCRREHNRGSNIGSFHHYELDVEREGFAPEVVAVGIAFVIASEDRRRPEATLKEIQQEYEALGFPGQFPDVDVEAKLRGWVDRRMIGDARHTGKHWYLFLSNRTTSPGQDRSPGSFHSWMKRYKSEYVKARVR